MTFTKIIAAIVSFTSLGALVAVPALGEGSSIKPLQAASLKVGAEYAIAYFTSDNGRCNLVVTRAGEPNWDQDGSLTVTRFESLWVTRTLSVGAMERARGTAPRSGLVVPNRRSNSPHCFVTG